MEKRKPLIQNELLLCVSKNAQGGNDPMNSEQQNSSGPLDSKML